MLPAARLGRYAVLGNHDYVEYSWRQFGQEAWAPVTAAHTLWACLRAMSVGAKTAGRLLAQVLRNNPLRFSRVANDTQALRLLLAAHDVQLLQNASLSLPGYPHLWLAGVDDPVEGQPDLDAALAGIPAEATVILLSHNPDLAFTETAQRAALVLSGHTHGGQVRLPLLGAVHTQGTLLPRHHAAGQFQLPGGGQMIVSRGMGESTPLRLRCPPEVVLVTLTS